MAEPLDVEIVKKFEGKNACLALGVDNEPDNKVDTCIDGFAWSNFFNASFTRTPYQVVATRFTNPWIVMTFVVPA